MMGACKCGRIVITASGGPPDRLRIGDRHDERHEAVLALCKAALEMCHVCSPETAKEWSEKFAALK